jgi:hypothetical protein
MALQTWVARFVVDHGRVTEEGGRLRSFQRRRLDESDVDLHILAEPYGDKGPDLAAQALEAIGRLFLQDRLSLTGGLNRALRSTHATLLDWNKRSLPRDQVAAGITAAIVNGSVVYLAQCGPSLAYLRRNERLERLVPVDPAANVPFGEGEIEPAIRRLDLAAGEMVLVASQSLSEVVDDRTLAMMLDRGHDEALPELYLLARDLQDFALFLISCREGPSDGNEVERVEPSFMPPPPVQPREQVLPAPVAPAQQRQERARREHQQRQEEQRRNALEAEPPAAPQAPVEPVHSNGSHNGNGSSHSNGNGATLADEVTPALEPAIPLASRSQAQLPERPQPLALPPPPPPVTSNEPALPVLVGPPPLDISRPVIRLRNDNSLGRGEYARTTGGSGFNFKLDLANAKMLRIGAVVAFLLLVAAFVPGMVSEGRGERLGSLVQSAQDEYARAGASPDPAVRRTHLDETRRLATEALRIDPQNAVATELRGQATTGLNAMDAITDLGAMNTLTTLSKQVTGEVQISGTIVQGGTVYLLDVKGGRVLSLAVGGPPDPKTLFKEGEAYRGTPAKRPIYFTWDATAGRILVLDAERKLFSVRPGETPDPLPLRRPGIWQSVTGMAAYDGNLYILDAKGKQIYRYLPAAAGFDSEPNPVLSGSPDLTDAQSLAVDGDVFIIAKDGVVKRFKGGVDAGFPLSGLDRGLKGSGLSLNSPSDEVYIADSANKRIVVTTRDGVFRRQLVSNAFTDLRSIAVDSGSGQIFVVVGDALLVAPIPK